MKLIDRYILRQYLVPLGYILGAFSLIYIILDLFERFPDFARAGLSVAEMALYYGAFLFAVNGFVPFIVMVLPIALLLGALYTLTVFARHNELTALCASGVSVRRLMRPFLGVGLLAVPLAVLAQELVSPAATQWTADFRRQRVHRVAEAADVVRDFLYHRDDTGRQWIVRKFNTRNPARLEDVKILQERPDGSLARELIARRAEWLDGRWWLYEMQERKYDTAGEPQGGLSAPSERPMEVAELTERPHEFLQELAQDSDRLSSLDIYRYLRSRSRLSRAARARRAVDLHVRLAMPWTCLVMVLLSLPAASPLPELQPLYPNPPDAVDSLPWEMLFSSPQSDPLLEAALQAALVLIPLPHPTRLDLPPLLPALFQKWHEIQTSQMSRRW